MNCEECGFLLDEEGDCTNFDCPTNISESHDIPDFSDPFNEDIDNDNDDEEEDEEPEDES